jgi:TonB family protein
MRALLLTLFVALALSEAESKCLAIYAPPPKYPTLPNGQRPEGKGLFVCHIDVKTGWVMSVSVAKSTGFSVLDVEAIDCFKRWRFKPGCAPDVKMPITFNQKTKP